jgi:hypothetical protein
MEENDHHLQECALLKDKSGVLVVIEMAQDVKI